MKALVTGATGFVGKHLVARLEREGIRAFGLSSSDVDFTADPSQIESSLLEILERTEADVVYHVAGPKPYAAPETCDSICVMGTSALLRALDSIDDNIRLVATGSSAEYGCSIRPRERISEEYPPRPSTAYGNAKLRQTEAVLGWGGVVLRLFNCLGPGQGDDVVAGRIVRQIASDVDRLAIRETASKRDFLDVRDAVDALWLAATKLPPGVYNVCSGRATGIDELINVAFEAAGIKPLPIDVEMPESEGSYQCGDPTKLESFGWMRRYELVESLRDAIEYERRRLQKGVSLSSSDLRNE
ncbi:MAG: hypothetical protein C4318_00570 [Acidimicrobiia bacterium]